MEERILMKVNDLEDKIMSVWSTADDIDTLLYRYLDSPAEQLSEDDISNTLIGIKALHDQRCQKLWDAFEQVLANNATPVKTTNPEVSSDVEDLRGYDSNGVCLLSDDDDEPTIRGIPVDDQRRLDSMGLEGLRSG